MCGIILLQHGEELDNIRVLTQQSTLKDGREEISATSGSNWSPVPSKQSTSVRKTWVGGIVSSAITDVPIVPVGSSCEREIFGKPETS